MSIVRGAQVASGRPPADDATPTTPVDLSAFVRIAGAVGDAPARLVLPQDRKAARSQLAWAADRLRQAARELDARADGLASPRPRHAEPAPTGWDARAASAERRRRIRELYDQASPPW